MSASPDAHVEKKNWKQESYRYLRQYRTTPLTSNGSSPFIHIRNQNQISVSFKNHWQPHRWNSERARYNHKLIRTHIVAYFKNHWPFHWFQILKGKMKLEYKNFPWDLWGVKIVLHNNKTKKWRLSTIKNPMSLRKLNEDFCCHVPWKNMEGEKEEEDIINTNSDTEVPPSPIRAYKNGFYSQFVSNCWHKNTKPYYHIILYSLL